jgi:ribosomal protein S27AE
MGRCSCAAMSCPRYARLYLAEIRDTDYRRKTFSCSRCGAGGALAITEPNTETGMTDYQLDKVEAATASPWVTRAAHWPAQARLSPVREALRGEGSHSLPSREELSIINVQKAALYASTLNRLFEQARYLAGGPS